MPSVSSHSVIGLFPAQAGVILRRVYPDIPQLPVPRASGGDPIQAREAGRKGNCSPRKRG